MSPAGSGPEFYVTFGSGRVKSGQENWTRARRTLCYMLFTCTLLLQHACSSNDGCKETDAWISINLRRTRVKVSKECLAIITGLMLMF